MALLGIAPIMTTQMVVSKMSDRQDHTAKDGCAFFASFTEQVVTEIGDQDQRNQPEDPKDENSAISMAAAA
jgi:hypothetical protein